MARVVVQWLQVQDWEVFQEVTCRTGSIDIVARRSGILWAIETKLSLSLHLLSQVWDRKGSAHYVSMAVPQSRDSDFVRRFCRREGFGILKVSPAPEGWPDEESRAASWTGLFTPVETVVAPKLNRRIYPPRLFEEQKDFSAAGSSGGAAWTPFKETKRAAQEFVARRPGCTIKELVNGIDHHYRSDTGARSSLLKWVRDGVIGGIELRREGRSFRLYPSD